jgi:hypothetical protein
MLKKILSLVFNFDRKLETKSIVRSDVQTLPEGDKPSGRRTEEPSTSVASTSAKIPFPDPWDGDWNDGVYIWEQINKERSL